MTRETWQFINTFAPWFSAIGTLLAVIVSLYLARSRDMIKLHITAGHRIIAGLGTSDFPEFLYIGIVNVGFRPARITFVGWKIGIFKKTHAVQVVASNVYSSPLPVDIQDGQEAKYLIPFGSWIDDFSNKFVGKPVRLRLHSLKLQVSTSHGKMYEIKIEKGLHEKIIEAISNKA